MHGIQLNNLMTETTKTYPLFSELMTVTLQPRKINNTEYDMPTVDGLDRCEINTKLHYLNVEMDKLKAQQSALIAMRDQLDHHAEMLEWEQRAKDADSLFDQMFGGE